MGSRCVITTDIAIEEAKNLHGDRYDYSLVEYINYETKLKIICPIHGIFEQKYQKHCKMGRGCVKCGVIKSTESLTHTTEIFIEKANLIHNNFYDYSKAEYLNNHTPITIICPIHGEFTTLPSSHTQGCGCPKCGQIAGGLKSRKGRRNIKKV